jgi:DNA-directed RNA polymerase sigma subunit (sigma70/sigma32)
MKCSRSEFLTAIESWRDSSCAVHLHTDEVSGAFVVTFRSASKKGVLEFSAHPLLQPLTVDLSDANEFEFVLPEHEIKGADSELVKQVADEIALARVEGKLVFSMTRLVDPFADKLAEVHSRPTPRTGAASAEPPVEPDDDDPVKMYRREIAKVEPLTKEEQTHLFQEAGKPGEQGEGAKRRILENTLHLVLPIAERHASSGLSLLDLIQEGNLGLMRALDNFSGTRLDDFSAYAAAYIEESISEAVARSKEN